MANSDGKNLIWADFINENESSRPGDFIKHDNIQSSFLQVVLQFFQENLKFQRVLEISGNIECRVDESLKIVMRIPTILAQVVGNSSVQGVQDDDESFSGNFDFEIDDTSNDSDYYNPLEIQKEKKQTARKVSIINTKKKSLGTGIVKPKRNVALKYPDIPRDEKGRIMLQCQFCKYKKRAGKDMQDHIAAVHTKAKKFECDKCDYKCTLAKYLKYHKLRKHENWRPFKCELCSYSASAVENLRNHVASVHTREFKYKCHLCEFKANQCNALKVHIAARHEKGSVEKPYECQLCEYKTAKNWFLRRHISRVHCNKEKLKCPDCEYVGTSLKDLRNHKIETHEDRPILKCDLCESYRTCNPYNLIRHKNTTHEEKKHKCPDCDFWAGSMPVLREHLKSTHQDIITTKYKCHECTYIASNTSLLKRHAKDVHNSDLPFKCPECDFKCSTVRDLDGHAVEEHGVKTVSERFLRMCDECDFSCAEFKTLKDHVLTAHAQ